MTKGITNSVKNKRGGCFDDFIAECEAVDAYVESLEKLVDLVFSKYSIEADLFEHESLEDFKRYMELADACHESKEDGNNG